MNNMAHRLDRRFRKEVRHVYDRALGALGLPKIASDLRRIKSIKAPAQRMKAIRGLVRKYPGDPRPHLELAQCMHEIYDPQLAEQMDCYGQIRREWLIQTGLDALDIEFVSLGIVIGALGNVSTLEQLLLANQFGLRPPKKTVLLLPERARLRNPSLFGYIRPHLSIIQDDEAIENLRPLESLLTLPLGLCLPLESNCPFLDFAANAVEQGKMACGYDRAWLELEDEHREKGMRALREMGLPEDAWYVTLHVREQGYHRGEGHDEDWRNSNPSDYLKAVEFVTKEGGWVFRMGDPSMTPLPSMPQVIDYAHHPMRCDWMDVFIGATSRFAIGTGSGFYHIPAFFGVPSIMSNLPMTVAYYGLKKDDIFIPRLLRRKGDNTPLRFSEQFSHPVSMIWTLKGYSDAGLEWVDNTPEELEAATREMFMRTSGDTVSAAPEDDLQSRFKAIAEECALGYSGQQAVRALASVGQDFLIRHADLLESGI